MIHQEKIEWKKCLNCGYLQHMAHLRCLNCKNDRFELVEAFGRAILLTFTVLKAVPTEFLDQKSYALGVVEFENGIKALGQITVKKDLKIGMNLKPIYKKICNNMDGKEVYGYVFEPI